MCERVKDLQAFDLVNFPLRNFPLKFNKILHGIFTLRTNPLRNISFNTLFLSLIHSHSRSLSLQIRQTALRLVRRIFDYIHFIYAYNSYVLTQPPYHRTLIALLCKSRVKKKIWKRNANGLDTENYFPTKINPPAVNGSLFSQR